LFPSTNAKEVNDLRGLNWRVVFLAILILSSAAVTLAMVAQNVEVSVDAFSENLPKLYLAELVSLEPIDDGPGG
jgi:hypothetical protein